MGEFADKMQTLVFHSKEAHFLLTGCADNVVRLFDCRDPNSSMENTLDWVLPNEVEKVIWNPLNTDLFMAGDCDGNIHYVDRRRPGQFLWSHRAHSEEISGICFNWETPNILATISIESMVKIWNYNTSEIKYVCEHEMALGRLQSMDQCPEDPFTLAFGGEKNRLCTIYNIKNLEAVRKEFNIPSTDE